MRKHRSTGASTTPHNVPPIRSLRFFTTKLLVLLAVALFVVGCKRDQGTQEALKELRKYRAAKAAKANGDKGVGKGQSARLRFAAYNITTPSKPGGKPSLGDLSKTPLGKNLDGFQFGTPLRYKRVVVYPIKVARALKRSRTPMTIDESFKKRKVKVTEEGSGNVPVIALKKRRSPPIFVMTGDMFLGAKQDRISKHDLLLPRHASRHKIPVYCVEQGRWRYGSGSSFRAGNTAGSWRLRRSASKKLSQGTIWRNVGSKTSNLNARTSTQTMAATYRSKLYRKQSPGYLRKLKSFAKRNPQAIGYLGMVRGKLANMELFANNKLFRKMWPKMSKAMVLDAIDPKYKGSKIDTKSLIPFLQQLMKARYKKTRTPGIGKEYLITHRYLSGTLLMHRKQLYHLSVFPDHNKGMRLKTNQRLRRLKRLYQRRAQAPYGRSANQGLGNVGMGNALGSKNAYSKNLDAALRNSKGIAIQGSSTSRRRYPTYRKRLKRFRIYNKRQYYNAKRRYYNRSKRQQPRLGLSNAELRRALIEHLKKKRWKKKRAKSGYGPRYFKKRPAKRSVQRPTKRPARRK